MLPRIVRVLAIATLAVGFARSSFAQTLANINFGAPVSASGPSEMLTTGTFHSSIRATTTTLVVGGVTFNSFDTSSISLSSASSVGYVPGAFSSGDATYNTLINRGLQSAVQGTNFRMTFNNLTIGNEYRLQIWTPAWDSERPTQIQHQGGTLLFGNTQLSPTYAVGTFTATVASHYIDVSATIPASRGVIAAAAVYDVTAIPEPSTYAALVGLGALGFAFWRRRSRRAIRSDAMPSA